MRACHMPMSRLGHLRVVAQLPRGPQAALKRAVRCHSGIWRKQNSRIRHAVYISGYADLGIKISIVGNMGMRLEFESADVRSQNGDLELQLWAMFPTFTCENTSGRLGRYQSES